MPAPIDYSVQVADPMQSFLSAFQTGATIREAGLKQEQQAQQLAQQKLIQEGFTKVRGPNATAADYANLQMLLPEAQAKAVREGFSMLSGERQNVALQQGGQVFSAFKAGKPEIAIQFMDQQIEAKRNSGDEAGAKFLETMRDVSKADPKAGEIFFGNNLVQMPGGDKLIEAANKLSGEARTAAEAPAALRQKLADADKKEADALVAQEKAITAGEIEAAALKLAQAQAEKEAVQAEFARTNQVLDVQQKGAQLGLTKAQTDSALAQGRKLGAEATTAILELEALKKGGTLATPKAFEQEEKLRKEFQGRTKVYGELGTTFNNIKSSAEAKNGPGDIALITGFMKMLDPGSVVRETEFATARDTAGLYTRLENSLKKAETGQFLQPNQRSEFVNLAKQYLDSAQKKAGDEKKALGVVVKNYRLNPENVFGPETEAAPGGQRVVNPPLPTGTPTNRNVTVDY